ncbi:DEAD/DEAH box helicase [Corallococcus carmarthensis]|uniref:DEAD/DEAH box helicase n=1 Tax=Corallococcus carmarthensis TaxID=2316728 RepID=UPI00148D603B|nr:DEAD/DEAH box helicase [Corallococcus carmarthensis]NOK18574.1 DEAD/DEAH box helicase [Corallococcus carmarthensis]
MPSRTASSPETSLQQRLTRPRLRELASRELLAQARQWLIRDAVDVWPPSQGCLRGTVTDGYGRLFDASLSVDPGSDGLLLECECTTYWNQGVCAHAISVGLAWLQSSTLWEGERAPPPRRTQPVSPRLTKAPSQPAIPDAIQPWLVEHHVERARAVPVAVLASLLPDSVTRHALPALRKATVVDVLEGSSKLRRLRDGERDALAEAAWHWMRDEAGRVSRGLAREASAKPLPPPTDDRLAPLRDALARTRARIRSQATPRLLSSAPRAILQEAPLRLLVKEPELAAWGHRAAHDADGEDGGAVVLEPRAMMEGRPGLSCPCSPKADEAPCVHALTAVDAALAFLVLPKHAALAARLAELLFEAPGRALLSALEVSLLDRAVRDAPATGDFVTFRLEPESLRGWRLRPYVHVPAKKGGLSQGRAVTWYDRDKALRTLQDPDERHAWSLLDAEEQMGRNGAMGYGLGEGAPYTLLLQALRSLAHSPRLRLAGAPDAAVRVREAPLGFALEEDGQALRLRPAVDGRPVPPEALTPPPDGPEAPQPWLFVEPGGPSVTLVSVPLGAVPLLESLARHGAYVSERQREALLGHLSALEAAFPVALPPSLEPRPVEASPGLLVRLRTVEDSALEVSLFVRPLAEAPPQPVGEGAPGVRGQRGIERVMVRRELDAERAEADALLARLSLPAGMYHFTRDTAEDALQLLEALEPLTGPLVRVEWAEQPWTVTRVETANVRVQVLRENDWFGAKGGVELDGVRVELAILLEAVRRRQRYVPLGKGRWMRLTEALREQLTPLADVAHPGRKGLEVSAAAAPVLDTLEKAGARVQAPPDWRQLAKRIHDAHARPVRVPRGLKAELRDYQREGFVWLARLTSWGAGACLADDMGLGKTAQALALLLSRTADGPALVVAPTSLRGNWVREAARFAPSLRVHVWQDADRDALPARLGPRDLLIISYGLLARDAAKLADVTFATLVVDEAQAVKNPDTARARALRGVKAEARVALTGTPVENRLSELWSLFHLLFPGLLGGRESFHARFAVPIERDRNADARASLARLVRPFLLRRTKAQVARELPPRVDTVVLVTLSDAERRLYDDVRLAALARLGEGTPGGDQRFEMLAALTRLRLAACHPRLVDPDTALSSSKLERVLERVEELMAEGGRALVFSQFVRHLTLVRDALEARGIAFQYLDGRTPPAERQARVEAFQRGEGALFLISLKAGGTGLNLTGADHVLHLDPWWNPAVEDQASDRAHRIGQTRPVTVSRFVAEGTIEEAILALHAEKRELADSLLSEADGAAALSPARLLGLLRFGAGTAED